MSMTAEVPVAEVHDGPIDGGYGYGNYPMSPWALMRPKNTYGLDEAKLRKMACGLTDALESVRDTATANVTAFVEDATGIRHSMSMEGYVICLAAYADAKTANE